jgi:uncharacterized phage protein gp47/JayE
MPIRDGEYKQYSAEEIYERLVADFEATFDETVEPGDIVQKQLEAEARTLADNQEEALERVYKSAYIGDAEGKELDKLVSLIGLKRRDAVKASGVVEFSREDPPLATYTIPANSELQTRGSDPIRFVTTESATLQRIDGFEDNLNLWTGDTTTFSLNTSNPINGSASLEIPATSGVEIETEETYNIGTHFNLDLNLSSGAVKAIKFGIKDTDNFHELIIDTSADYLTLRTVKEGSEAGIRNITQTLPTSQVSHLEIQWNLNDNLYAAFYDSEEQNTQIGSITLDYQPDWYSGAIAVRSEDSTATVLADDLSTTLVTSNIEAVNGGIEGNVGPDNITVATNGLTGVQNITNPIPTGDKSFTNTDFDPLVLGRDREEDDDLQERAFENTSIGGAASLSALETALGNIDGVQSLSIKRNRKDISENGLPAHSFEPIIYGGDPEEIAQKLHETASIDSTDVGGVNGTETTSSIKSDVTGETEIYHWSVPQEINLNITVDIVKDSTYIGDEEVQSIIANYIGGTDIDGSQVAGIDNGEDVYEAVLKGRLVSPDELGIWEVDSVTIDDNADGLDDTTTKTSGADVYAVADSEVAVTNARDGSITINTTNK